MAPDSAKVVNKARELAITHILVGLLLVIFGIADRFTDSWTGDKYFGIWIGVWMCITGGLGIPGSRKERSTRRNSFAGVYMGFSIASTVLGGIIILLYVMTMFLVGPFTFIVLVLGIVEFIIGIWAAVCVCLMKPCCYSASLQQGQVTGDAGYVMTQGPSGVPVAIPMQACRGVVAVQTVISGAQGVQQQMILLPVSGPEGYQVDMPPPYEEEEKMT